jgi:hypothetical protein
MKALMKLLPMAAAILFTGCASIMDRQFAYQHDHSKAYNVARAGDLFEGIKDTAVPIGQSQALSNAVLTTGYAGANFLNPQLGMSNWTIGGLSLLDSFLAPDSHSERNSLLAWMPIDMADSDEEAQAVMLEAVKQSSIAALGQLGIENKSIYSTEEFVSIDILNESWGCYDFKAYKERGANRCRIKIYIFEPFKHKTPDFVSESRDEIWKFRANHKYDYNRIHFDIDEGSDVPTDQIYQQISKLLPSWAYLYVAPRKIKNDGKTDYTFPYILNEGEINLFVKESKAP